MSAVITGIEFRPQDPGDKTGVTAMATPVSCPFQPVNICLKAASLRRVPCGGFFDNVYFISSLPELQA